MKSIPLYDASVPIACTEAGENVLNRLAQIERLRATLSRIERTEHGMVLAFPDRPEVEADVRRFTVDEKRCCAFWGFDVSKAADEIVLRWDAPPALDDYVERLIGWFRSDEPLDAATGLL